MKYIFLIFISAFIFCDSHAQDSSLLNMLNDSLNIEHNTQYIEGTFKGTHVINMQTVEAPARGALNFIIMHRFGKLNDGAYNFFGLDNATIRLALDYGITDRFAVGIGRSSFEKTFDASLKYKILRQTEGKKSFPFTVSLYESIINYSQKFIDKPYLNFKYRTAYTSQLLIARKFNRNFSLQLAPTWLHYNLVPTVNDNNNVFALGAAGRMKITKRMSINAEYNYFSHNQLSSLDLHDSFSLGFDIETGGHVFQLVFTNSQAITEPQYIGKTTGSWGNGDIFFGFNISRNFNLSKHAKSNPGWKK